MKRCAQWRCSVLMAALLLMQPLVSQSASLSALLRDDPAQIDVCAYLPETVFIDLIGVAGVFFSQSVDAAYQRFADEDSTAPVFSGCWWQLSRTDNSGIVMMQLQLYPVTMSESRARIDMVLEAADGMHSSLRPERLDALGDAALWSQLGKLVRWRYGDELLLELVFFQQGSDQAFDSDKHRQTSLRAARAVDRAIQRAYPQLLRHP